MTAPLFRQVDQHSGETVPVPAELESCAGCKAKQLRIAQLETALAAAEKKVGDNMWQQRSGW
jgi:hypothetical protein